MPKPGPRCRKISLSLFHKVIHKWRPLLFMKLRHPWVVSASVVDGLLPDFLLKNSLLQSFLLQNFVLQSCLSIFPKIIDQKAILSEVSKTIFFSGIFSEAIIFWTIFLRITFFKAIIFWTDFLGITFFKAIIFEAVFWIPKQGNFLSDKPRRE